MFEHSATSPSRWIGLIAKSGDPVSVEPCAAFGDILRRYVQGQVRQTVLEPGFVPSRKEDVPHVDSLPRNVRDSWWQLGLQRVQAGQVAYAVLAAGAASRMDPKQLPEAARTLLERAGRKEVPRGKALIPVCQYGDRVWTYLDLFATNVARFLEQSSGHGPVIIFCSSANADECQEHLRAAGYGGLADTSVWQLVQPLVPAVVARPEDAIAARAHFPPEEWEAVLRHAQQHAGELLPYQKPAGHGEFLHQLMASGMVLRLWQQGVRYLSVRNIDNLAALLDYRWLIALGYLDQQGGDLLVEVSQRPLGQKGGALIRRGTRWQIAEDPSFAGTNYRAQDSYYINNAVAILSLDLFWKLYDTSPEELTEIKASHEQWETAFQGIADRGRAKFPTLIEAKPWRTADGQLVAAVVPETNLWESTLSDARLVLVPWAVDSDQDAGLDFLEQPPQVKERRALAVRFCPVKNWADYLDARKQWIVHRLARRILSEPLIYEPAVDETSTTSIKP